MAYASRWLDLSRPHQRLLAAVLAVVLSAFAFKEGLLELISRWVRQEEYSHGFLIPVVVVWMLWSRRAALASSAGAPSWSGPLVIMLSIIMLVVGELSAFFLLSQLGFIVALFGIILAVGGLPLLKVTFIPISFLVFAIPLPYFIDSELSWRLQLISSQLGVAFIRLFGVSVYLAGNVIDLGNYKLQVVEACSGLRYLYPLLSFGFLAAYCYQAPFWQRALIFFSAIPITIVMNSLRIGIVGVLVDRWGTAQAEGLLHFFEGWVIFLACAAILAAEIALMARLFLGRRFLQVFSLPEIPITSEHQALAQVRYGAVATAAIVVLCTGGLANAYVSARQESVPDRLRFVAFPSELGPWQGRPSSLEPQIEHSLALEDYILSDYTNPKSGVVNFYVAYYASQRKGTSPHSPIVCIPGDGWQITTFQRASYSSPSLGVTLPFNRVVIAREKSRQLVYYWFVQRGRHIANEYWSKWYLFVDAITMNRTDGALVRLVTPLNPGEDEALADQRLRAFVDQVEPRLRAYLPQAAPGAPGRIVDASTVRRPGE